MVKRYVKPQVRVMTVETADSTLVDFSNGEPVKDSNFEVGSKGNDINDDTWQDDDN